MPTEKDNESYLELYDIGKKETVAKTSLAKVRFIPRTGERIFFPHQGPGDWISYTVLDVHYFLGFDSFTGKPARSSAEGLARITLYVEASK